MIVSISWSCRSFWRASSFALQCPLRGTKTSPVSFSWILNSITPGGVPQRNSSWHFGLMLFAIRSTRVLCKINSFSPFMALMALHLVSWRCSSCLNSIKSRFIHVINITAECDTSEKPDKSAEYEVVALSERRAGADLMIDDGQDATIKIAKPMRDADWFQFRIGDGMHGRRYSTPV